MRINVVLSFGFFGAVALSGLTHASEFTEEDARKVMFDFSRVATCSYAESPDELLAAKVVKADEGMGQYGERFAVVWNGDVECAGGSGTSSWQVSFVELGVGSFPFVDLSKPPVSLAFLNVNRVSIDSAGDIVVEGERYDPREGSGNQDFVNKATTINPEGEVVQRVLYVDGEEVPESDLD